MKKKYFLIESNSLPEGMELIIADENATEESVKEYWGETFAKDDFTRAIFEDIEVYEFNCIFDIRKK
jgi:hypothetical protein